MFVFLLIVCTPVNNGVECLPPQVYKTVATCQAVGSSYIMAAGTSGVNSRPIATRCVRVEK